ncbi:hypothetical protein SNE35_18690 [Paucibacter sp. R3-3]|uniref:Uncharacterized protein n=1 Tax=Roseateles agri TaxID=3098619 RepID=A0ABU5DJS4_9BURK|nr:hypothetical protein [Paucibacter sp. R3-3]MDY0746548.1 hypothetical protein [Paucibacter sp. R3-3]
MIGDMAAIAVECVRTGRPAIWAPNLGRYVCPQVDAIPEEELDRRSMRRPPISAQFKLIFVTAAVGTALSLLLCVCLTLAAGRDPPSLLTELVRGLFDLAKVGFGAIVGLLGAKRLEADGGDKANHEHR